MTKMTAAWRGVICTVIFLAGPDIGANPFKEARELEPNPDQGRSVYVVCSGCHRPEGWGTPSGIIPQIAGQHPRVVMRQLEHFSKGYRKSADMTALVNADVLDTPRVIADVSGYISRLPMTPAPGYGHGGNLQRGRALFDTACGSRCHGEDATGSDWKMWPRLHGQHYGYLLRQMELFRKGERRFADNLMVRRLGRFSGDDLQAVADYLSRLSPEPARVAPPGWTNPDFR